MQLIDSTIALPSVLSAKVLNSFLYDIAIYKLNYIPFQLLSHYYRIVPSSAAPQLSLGKHV